MPYCFLGSSIKYQGHTGWKIDDLNPVWVRLLGRSQLSNPSDLPCLKTFYYIYVFIYRMKWKIFSSRLRTRLIWEMRKYEFTFVFSECCVEFIFRNCKNVFPFSMVSEHWGGTGSSNLSLWKTRYKDLFILCSRSHCWWQYDMQGARASAAIVLIQLSWNIPVQYQRG